MTHSQSLIAAASRRVWERRYFALLEQGRDPGDAEADADAYLLRVLGTDG